jgi:hypothetical protein
LGGVADYRPYFAKSAVHLTILMRLETAMRRVRWRLRGRRL